ncbi:MAG: hypothetical protein ABIP75_15335 [Pyrinomonadaceae bacterium]
MPYRVVGPPQKSAIYVVQNSTWLNEVNLQSDRHYPESRNRDTSTAQHFVVCGHDNYYDIIATGFDETLIPEAEAGDLIRLIEDA